MAFSSANLATAETTGFDNDKPMMVVQKANAMSVDSPPTDAHWTIDGAHTDTDKTDATTPATRAYDNAGSLITKTISGAASSTTKFYNFYYGTGISFDTFILLGHNLNSTDATTVHLDVADNDDFDSNVREIAKVTLSGSTSNRILIMNLNSAANVTTQTVTIANTDKTVTVADSSGLRVGDSVTGTNIPANTCVESITDSTHIEITNAATNSLTITATFTQYNYAPSGTAQRFSSVQRVRLRIIASGSFTPEVGEIVLGQRYQLQRNPNVPWNNKNEVSDITDFKALSGLNKRYSFYRGQAKRSFSSSFATAAEITVIEDWWVSIEQGTKPFFYIETPSSSPKTLIVIIDEATLDFQLVGPFERSLEFSMTEQPPYLGRE